MQLKIPGKGMRMGMGKVVARLANSFLVENL